MIPLSWVWCGLCVLSLIGLALLTWAWYSVDEVESSDEEQRSQSRRNE